MSLSKENVPKRLNQAPPAPINVANSQSALVVSTSSNLSSWHSNPINSTSQVITSELTSWNVRSSVRNNPPPSRYDEPEPRSSLYSSRKHSTSHGNLSLFTGHGVTNFLREVHPLDTSNQLVLLQLSKIENSLKGYIDQKFCQLQSDLSSVNDKVLSLQDYWESLKSRLSPYANRSDIIHSCVSSRQSSTGISPPMSVTPSHDIFSPSSSPKQKRSIIDGYNSPTQVCENARKETSRLALHSQSVITLPTANMVR